MRTFILRFALPFPVIVLICVAAFAQRTPGTFPVIVVFKENASLDSFQASYQRDAREATAPTEWRYLDKGLIGAVQMMEHRHAFRADHAYSSALRGFAARLNSRQITELEEDGLVAYVVADTPVWSAAQVLPWGVDRVDADISSTSAGDGKGVVSNVTVYVIDTGVDTQHTDLNVANHVGFARGKNVDCHGHGTHVAGTVAAQDNIADVVGVAPGAPVVGVKVLDCNGFGFASVVIKGVDWLTANAARPAVANMSLGGAANQAVDDAIIRSADSGVLYSIAAGNSGANACNYSPSRAGVHDGVVTVAATDSNNLETPWSNYGSCVDIWAPGAGILSTKLGGGTTTMSGTSMAAPHVAGAAALYLSSSPASLPAATEAALKSGAVQLGGSTDGGRGKKGGGSSGGSKDGRAIQLLNVSAY